MPTEGQWKSAVDKRSGKTYYYHTVTRETQWKKPMELASDDERSKLSEKEAKQKDFFAAMEANILNSLSQGVVPGTDEDPSFDKPRSSVFSKGDGRPELERTISSMDDSLLKNLIRRQPSIRQPSKVESIQSTVSSLGGFESIIRQPSRLASVSEMFDGLPDEDTTRYDDDEGFDGNLSARSESLNKSSGNFDLDWEETQELKKLSDIAKGMTIAGDDESKAEQANIPRQIDLPGKDTSKIKVSEVPMTRLGNRAVSGPASFQKAKNIGGRELDFDPSDSDSDEEVVVKRPDVKRRNTCGTIYVSTTMSAPDKDATIKCVCGVFRTHILTSEIVDHDIDPKYKVFDDHQEEGSEDDPRLDPPSLDEVTKFYRDIFLKAQMESDCIIMSLIYVERLIKKTKGALRPRASNWRSLIFSCMILSSKVWDDLSMWNVDFSQSCPKGVSFPLERINELEINILNTLNFVVKVPAGEYAKYYFLLRSMLIKSGLGGNDVSSPLDIESARRLQQVSSQFENRSMTKGRHSFESGNRSQSLNPNILGARPTERKTAAQVGLEHVVEM